MAVPDCRWRLVMLVAPLDESPALVAQAVLSPEIGDPRAGKWRRRVMAESVDGRPQGRRPRRRMEQFAQSKGPAKDQGHGAR